ncbi:MAG: helix-turn-helix transcriptional regulator [Lachnospiraceae bacterium]|nr:helix-turn-helix transcriptional regulator [Lachnospiraceae bacterium]
MVHKNTETLGQVIKKARKHHNLTIEALAEKIGVSERYLYRIENEGKKPSFDVLYSLVRALSISSDSIFYPEKPTKESEIEDLVRMLYNCNERDLEIVKAVVKIINCN